MSFLPVRGPGQIIRLPTAPNDPSVPEWARGRRAVLWTEDYAGAEGNLVVGGVEPPPHHHPDQEERTR